jgi:hypothetical protein
MLTLMKCPWKSLSVFFPVFNEAEAMPALIDRALVVLGDMDLDDYEVIVVDDGSSDETGRIADEYAAGNSRVRVVHHAQNQGYGEALESGFAAAEYEWVAYTDGDGQFDLADIRRFYEPSTRVDAVLGYRRVRNDHLGRKLNAWVWGWLVRLILNLSVRDLDCGFKLFKTQRVRTLGMLEARGAVISAELLMKLKAAGCAWEQVVVEHYPRNGGAPSGANAGVILRAVRELLLLRRKMRLQAVSHNR